MTTRKLILAVITASVVPCSALTVRADCAPLESTATLVLDSVTVDGVAVEPPSAGGDEEIVFIRSSVMEHRLEWSGGSISVRELGE